MSVTTPILRDDRERIVTGTPYQTVLGPFDFTIYDGADVVISVKEPDWDAYRILGSGLLDDDDPIATGYAIAPATPATAFPARFTVTLDQGRPDGTLYRITGKRTHERVTDVTQGGAVNSVSLERELDRQTVVLQELRRDVDRFTGLPEDFDDALASAQEAAQDAVEDRIAAQAARDTAITAAGESLVNLPSAVAIESLTIVADYVRTAGDEDPGDGGGALFKEVGAEPAYARGKRQDAGGKWFQITEQGPELLARSFGVKADGLTDDTDAMLGAIEVAKGEGLGLFMPPGRIVFEAPLVWMTDTALAQGARIRGAGEFATVLVNRSDDFALKLLGNNGTITSGRHAYGARVSDFSVERDGAGTNEGGIYILSQWYAKLFNISADGMKQEALKIQSLEALGDDDSSAHIWVDSFRATNGLIYGVHATSAFESVGVSQCRYTRMTINGNADIGMLFTNTADMFVGNQSSITGNLGGGMLQQGNGTTPQQLNLDAIEFGNGNVGYDLWVAAGIGGGGKNLMFTRNAGEAGGESIRLGDGASACRDMEWVNNRFRIHASHSHTAYKTNLTAGMRVINPVWQVFASPTSTPAQRAYNFDDGSSVEVIDQNIQSRGAWSESTNAFTPKLWKGEKQRCVCSDTPTISAPDPNGRELVGGERFSLSIFNNHASVAKTPIFATGAAGTFLVSAPAIAAQKRRTVRFEYDALSARWEQQGDWSADLS